MSYRIIDEDTYDIYKLETKRDTLKYLGYTDTYEIDKQIYEKTCIKVKKLWISKKIREYKEVKTVASIFCVIFLLCSFILSYWCIYCSKQLEDDYLGYINTSDYYTKDAGELYYYLPDVDSNEMLPFELPNAGYKILSYTNSTTSTNLILFELQDIKTGQIYNDVRFYSNYPYRGTLGIYSISRIEKDKDKFGGAINIMLLSYVILACSVVLTILTFCFGVHTVRTIRYLESQDTLHYNPKEDYCMYV